MAGAATFRVFVSSTFSDLVEERDALQRWVFPSLRRLCRDAGARFQAIDLRWGVSDEAVHDQQTLRVCLAEVERCQRTTVRPNFVAILGERYGWRPAPPELGWAELDRIVAGAPSGAGVLLEWYRRDDNAVPAAAVLRVREGRFLDPAVWSAVERDLRRALAAAAGPLRPSDLGSFDSATAQEIRLALSREGADVHVFVRRIADLQPDRATPWSDGTTDGAADPEARAALEGLVASLEAVLPAANVHRYRAHFTGSTITHDHLRPLSEQPGSGNLVQGVHDVLAAAIREELAARARADPLEEEIHAHATFAEERARFFTGRAEELEAIARRVSSDARTPLAVVGAPGAGKSALLARAARTVRDALPDAIIVSRFIGATPASSTVRALLGSVAHEAHAAGGLETPPLPSTFGELVKAVFERLGVLARSRPVVVLLDALDQLSDEDYGRNLGWLPLELPNAVRVVVSAIDDSDAGRMLAAVLTREDTISIAPMSPREGDELLDAWFAGADPSRPRTLQPAQRAAVTSAFARSGLPLFLRLAFEEARLWRSWEVPRPLPVRTIDLMRDLLARLSMPTKHGPLLVERALAYLAAARHGLTEDEVLDVLTADADVMADVVAHAHHALLPDDANTVVQLPVAIWSRLRHDLERYLVERAADGTAPLAFFHGQLRDVVAAHCLTPRSGRVHEALARYFSNGPRDGRPELARDLRRLSELPYHQREAGMWTDLRQTLCELRFIEAKCASGMAYDLVAEYLAALATPALPETEREPIAAFARFVRAQAHVLSRRPHLTLQQAANEFAGTPPGDAARRLLASSAADTAWLRRTNGERSRCLMTLEGHGANVNACDVSADGRWIVSASTDRTVRVWDAELGVTVRTLHQLVPGVAASAASAETCALSRDGRLVSGDRRNRIFLWKSIEGGVPRVIDVHREPVATCAFSPDGRRFASASWDGTVRIWDAETGDAAVAQPLRGRAKMVACAYSPDGARLVTGGSDGELRLWDAHTGAPIDTPAFEGHSRGIWTCRFGADDWLVTASEDGTLVRWDARTGARVAEFRGHFRAVWTLAISPDGRLVASGSADRTVRIWDAQDGTELAVLRGHEGEVWCVSFFPNGERVVSASWDATLEVWDVSGLVRPTAPLSEAAPRAADSPAARKDAPMLSCACSPDGSLFAGGRGDGTVVLWDAETSAVRAVHRVHAFDWPTALAFAPGGGRLVAGLWEGGVRLVNLASGQVDALPGHPDMIRSCSFSRDGRRLVCVSAGRIAVHGLADGEVTPVAAWDDADQPYLAAVLSPDGLTLHVGSTPRGGTSADAGVVSWDVASRAEVATVASHAGLRCCDLSPDGTRLVTASDDGDLRVWRLDAPGSEPLRLEGHQSTVEAARFSRDGTLLVSASWDRTVRVWSSSERAPRAVLVGHSDDLQDACFDATGGRVLSACMDGTLRAWDVASAAELAVLVGPNTAVVTCAFSEDGSLVVSASHSGTLQLRDSRTGVLVRALAGHRDDVLDAAQSRDGTLVSASADGTLAVWDVRTGERRAELRGHGAPVSCCAVASDGSLIASGGRDGAVLLWRGGFPTRIGTFGGWLTDVAFSRDGRWLAASARDGRIVVWDARSGAVAADRACGSPVERCALTPGGEVLVYGTIDGRVATWRWSGGAPPRELVRAGGAVRAVALSSDGGRVAAVTADGSVLVHRIEDGAALVTVRHGGAWSCAFSPDGRRVVTGAEDRFVRVLDCEGGGVISEYPAGGPVRAVAWSADGSRIAAYDATGDLHLLEPRGAAAGVRS